MKFPIPQDWDNVTWCRWSVCWPASEGWEGFLRGLLTLPMRGWTWDERTGSILAVQAIGREITEQNLPLNGVIMACNDTNLADALNNIAIAISNSNSATFQASCCGTAQNTINNSIQSIVNQPIGGNSIPVYGSEPILAITPGSVPAGYETVGEYNTDKCRKANSLINAMIATLRALGAISSFNFAGLSVTAVMAISGVLVVAPPLIPILIGGLIVLAVAIHVLDDAADAVESNKAEWVCTLYEGDNTEGIISNIADLVDGVVSLIGAAGVVGNAVKLIIMVLLNGDNINKLLTDAPMLGITEIDCSGCLNGYQWHFDEDAMGWTWEQVSGGQDDLGTWTDSSCSEGALVVQIMTALAETNIQAWRIDDVDVGEDIAGQDLSISIASEVFPITLYRKVTYFDNSFTELIEDIGANGNHHMTIDPLTIKDIYITIGLSSTNPSYEFLVCINAVTVS